MTKKVDNTRIKCLLNVDVSAIISNRDEEGLPSRNRKPT